MTDNDARTSDATEYVGFWPRVWASIIDCLLTAVLLFPLLRLAYGDRFPSDGWKPLGVWDLLITYILPPVAVILFWIYKSATPGKMVIGARIVDARTGGPASRNQLIGRYFGYYVSFLPLGLGYFWVAFDDRRQGWHDKLAGTVVIRARRDA